MSHPAQACFRRAPASGGLVVLLLLVGCPPTVSVERMAAGTVGGVGGSGAAPTTGAGGSIGGSGGIGNAGGSGGIGGAGGSGGYTCDPVGTGGFANIGGGPVTCTGAEHWASLGYAPDVIPLSIYPYGWASNDHRIFGCTSNPTSGGIYDLESNTWSRFCTELLPACEQAMIAGAGSRFVVWGGFAGGKALQGGGIYDPATSSWTPTASAGAPPGRGSGAAVSTGDRIIMWGGRAPSEEIGTGAVLDVAANSWTPMTEVGAPAARFWHSAVWTGSSMIVWGGASTQMPLASGGIYDPATDTWKPTSMVGAPEPRSNHTAVWTGSRMIVWGGQTSGEWPNTGASYDPVTDTWTPMSTENAPPGCEYPILVWTGSRLLVAGGVEGNTSGPGPRLSIYDPATNTWQAAAPPPAMPVGNPMIAVWTGCAAVFWGTGSQPVGWMYEPPPG